MRIIYVGGLGRSGSTLFERLLGELPGIRPVGEIVHLWRRGIVEDERCGCGKPFSDCGFWRQVGEAAFGGWEKVDVDRIFRLQATVDRTRFIPLLAAPALRSALLRPLEEYVSYYLRVYTAIVAVSGCGAIIDSSKHASLAFCLRWCPSVDLRVVHVVRDSRAVAYSWGKAVSRPDVVTESRMWTYSPVSASMHWNAQNGALHLLARVGTPTLRVRYEDLVRDPEATLREIAVFAGIPAQETRFRFLGGHGDDRWADLTTAHTASGNPMRFATGRIPIHADEKWRTAMPSRQRRAVTALTMPLLAHYGYGLGAA